MVFNVGDDAYGALGVMDRNWYTSVPVYRGEDLVGVLSERSMLRWAVASADDDVKLAELRTLADIEEYLECSPGPDGGEIELLRIERIFDSPRKG